MHVEKGHVMWPFFIPLKPFQAAQLLNCKIEQTLIYISGEELHAHHRTGAETLGLMNSDECQKNARDAAIGSYIANQEAGNNNPDDPVMATHSVIFSPIMDSDC